MDRNHLQLRQVEFINQLSTDRESAKIFYGGLYLAARELGEELPRNGFDVTAIF